MFDGELYQSNVDTEATLKAKVAELEGLLKKNGEAARIMLDAALAENRDLRQRLAVIRSLFHIELSKLL